MFTGGSTLPQLKYEEIQENQHVSQEAEPDYREVTEDLEMNAEEKVKAGEKSNTVYCYCKLKSEE